MKLEKAYRKKETKKPAIVAESKTQRGESILKTQSHQTKPYGFGYEDK